jgi:hypothetical protein
MNRVRGSHRAGIVEIILGLVYGVVGGVFGYVGTHLVLGGIFGFGFGVGVFGLVAGVLSLRWEIRASRDRARRSGLAWPARARQRAAEGGFGWRFLACLTVDGLVDHLLGRAARQLPRAFRERFTEEWEDHRTHLRGVRLVWWALCVRATATRTGRELRRAELPRIEGS